MSANTSVTKRRRLNYACNRCRQRKARCDAGNPKCSNCVSAGVACVTTDPRRGHMQVQRASTDTPENTIETSPHGPPTPSPLSQELREREATETERQLPDQSEQNISDPKRRQLPAFPRLRPGDNSLALTHWLDLAFKRLGVPMKLTSRSQQPRPFSGLPTASEIISILKASEVFSPQDYSRHYCSSINRIFPLFEEDTVSTALNHLPSRTDAASLEAITACLVVASVIWSTGKENLDISRACIGFALANINVVLITGSLRSVQICVLMALNLRARSDIGAASNIISLGSAIAHNLDMHRAKSFAGIHPESPGSDRESWCWWSLYCVEKIICLELERPSVIRDFDCNQTIPRHSGETATDQDRLWQSLITLCQLQSETVERLCKSRSAEEQPLPNWNDIKREKVQMCTEIDTKLLQWATLQPFDLNTSDTSSFSPEIAPMFAFLTVQYQQTLFAIQRNMLILNPRAIEEEIVRWSPNDKSRFRVTRGAKICADIARAVVAIADDIHDGPYQNIVFSEHALLMAIYTFAITVLRNSSPGMVRSDLELQARAIELAIEYRSHLEETARSNHAAFLWELHRRVAARAPRRPSQSVEREPQSFVQSSSLIQQPQENQSLSNDEMDDAATTFNGPATDFDMCYAMPIDTTSSFDVLDWESLAFTYDLPL